MTAHYLYLLCFATGALWALVSLAVGGLHFGAGHGGHAHWGHHGHHGGVHHSASHGHGMSHNSRPSLLGHLGWGLADFFNPSCIAIFLSWFGGVGYLLTGHSGLALWLNTALATASGLAGAALLLWFLRTVQAHEKPLDPADYNMVGVLGRITCGIRPDGAGELLYVRDGARRLAPARSEEGIAIGRGEEVIVVRYEKGFAYVRTWAAMTQGPACPSALFSSQKEIGNVE